MHMAASSWPKAPHRVPIAEDGRGSAVADGGAHGPGEGPGHHPVSQDLLRRHPEGVLGVGVQRRVVMVLGGDVGQLFHRAFILLHVLARGVSVHVHEGGMVPAHELAQVLDGIGSHVVAQPDLHFKHITVFPGLILHRFAVFLFTAFSCF